MFNPNRPAILTDGRTIVTGLVPAQRPDPKGLQTLARYLAPPKASQLQAKPYLAARTTAQKPPPAHPFFYSKFEIAPALHPCRAIPADPAKRGPRDWLCSKELEFPVELLGLCSEACPLPNLNMGSLTHLSRLKCVDSRPAASTLTLYGGRLAAFKNRFRIAYETRAPTARLICAALFPASRVRISVG